MKLRWNEALVLVVSSAKNYGYILVANGNLLVLQQFLQLPRALMAINSVNAILFLFKNLLNRIWQIRRAREGASSPKEK